jgi:hypothetical protein
MSERLSIPSRYAEKDYQERMNRSVGELRPTVFLSGLGLQSVVQIGDQSRPIVSAQKGNRLDLQHKTRESRAQVRGRPQAVSSFEITFDQQKSDEPEVLRPTLHDRSLRGA